MVLTVIISIRYSRGLQQDRQCHAPQGRLADLTDLGGERLAAAKTGTRAGILLIVIYCFSRQDCCWADGATLTWALDKEMGVSGLKQGTAPGKRCESRGTEDLKTRLGVTDRPSPSAPGLRQKARQVSSRSHTPAREELQSTSHWSCTNWSVISRVKMLTNFLHALVQSWDSASGQMASVPPTV